MGGCKSNSENITVLSQRVIFKKSEQVTTNLKNVSNRASTKKVKIHVKRKVSQQT